MSISKIARVSALLVGLSFQGCGKTTVEETTAPPTPPQRKIRPHLKKEKRAQNIPNDGWVQNVKPHLPSGPSADVFLAEKRAAMMTQLALAQNLVSAAPPSPLDFTTNFARDEVLEEFDNMEFVYSGVDFESRDTTSVVVGRLGSDAEVVLQYASSQCGMKDGVNPLVRSFIIMKAVSLIDPDVVPEPLFLSSEARLDASHLAPVIKGIVLPQNMAQCLGADYRFIATERFGSSVHALLVANGAAMDLASAVKLLGMVIEQLQVLHEAGVVHGGIHWGHVLVEPMAAVRLIGFERAYVAGNLPKTLPSHSSRTFLTSNESAGKPSVFGDDILRAYEMFAAALAGPEYAFIKGNSINRFPMKTALIDEFNTIIYKTDPAAVPKHARLLELLAEIQHAITGF